MNHFPRSGIVPLFLYIFLKLLKKSLNIGNRSDRGIYKGRVTLPVSVHAWYPVHRIRVLEGVGAPVGGTAMALVFGDHDLGLDGSG